MDIAAALEWLVGHYNVEASPSVRRPPSLARIEGLVDLLAHPERQYPVIHLTGTNGKTSTARMISSLLVANGLAVGSYTKPDLGRVNERIAWNGDPIDDDALAEVLTVVAAVESLLPEKPNYFETVTAAAFVFFADHAVDVAVVEAGLGARWDATSVVQPVVSVVTNVGIDHAEFLGPTRVDIAREKSAIAKPGSILVCGETDPELVAIFEGAGADATWVRDREFGCDRNVLALGGRVVDIRTPGAGYGDVFVPMHGAHQGDNAAVALTAVEAFFGAPLAEDVVLEGFAAVRSPGRIEVAGRQPLIVLDGAHNPAAAAALVQSIDEAFDVENEVLVFGCMRDRDPVELLTVLASGRRRPRLVVACAADWPKARPVDQIVDAATTVGLPVVSEASVGAAVARGVNEAMDTDLVLVTGSLYVVGEARTALDL